MVVFNVNNLELPSPHRFRRLRHPPASDPSHPSVSQWGTPPRRRIKSADAAVTWHLALDIVRNSKGRRELHVFVTCRGHELEGAIELRRLFFWLLLLLAIVPISSLRLTPFAMRMSIATNQMTSSRSAVAGATAPCVRLPTDPPPCWIDDTLPELPPETLAAINTTTLAEQWARAAIHTKVNTSALTEQCAAQIELCGIDELNDCIMNEVCSAVGLHDDGSFSSLARHIVDVVYDGCDFSPQVLKKVAIRSSVSMGMHKLALAAWAPIACAIAHAPGLHG